MATNFNLENAIRWIENAPPCILQFYPSNSIAHKASWWTNKIFDNILEEIKSLIVVQSPNLITHSATPAVI